MGILYSLSLFLSLTHTPFEPHIHVFPKWFSQQPHSELNLSWVLSSLLVLNTLEFAQLTPSSESCLISLLISHNLHFSATKS